MVQRYRAGTAFVEVVPSFKGMQKDIARHFRENLRKELSDKKAFEGLEKNLERAFAKGIEGASESTRKKIREVLLEIENDTGKSAERSVKKIREMTKDIGGSFEADIRKAGKALQKALGDDFGRGLSKEHHELRGKVRKDLDLLARAYTDGGVQNEREIRRAYARMEKSLKEFQDLPSISSATRGNAARGLEALDSSEYLRTLRNMNAAEVKAHRDHQRDMHNAEVAANKKTESEQERHDQKMASIDAAEAKRRHAADARERARAAYNRERSGRRQNIGSFESEDRGRQTRADRLSARSDAQIAKSRANITAFIRDLQRLDRTRPRVIVDTAEGVQSIERFQDHLRRLHAGPHRPLALTVEFDEQDTRDEAHRLKRYAEWVLGTIDLDVELDDEGARRDLAEYKRQLEALSAYEAQPRIDTVGLHEAAREVRDLRGSLDRLERGFTEVKVIADTNDASQDVHMINAALASLRDRTVGVDITEQEALAEIALIQAAAERLEEKHEVEVDVVYDRDLFRRFTRDMELGRARLRRLGEALRNTQISMADTTQAFRLFSPIMAGVVFAGAPLVSLLGGVAGGLGAVASAAPGVLSGVLPLVAAFGDLSEASGFYEAAQEALTVAAKDRTDKQKEAIKLWEAEKEALGEATAAWIEYTQEFGPRLDGIRQAARDGLFPGLMASIDNLFEYEKPLTDFMETMARLLADVSERWSGMLTSVSAQNWFERVAEDAELYVPAILTWVENIVSGFAGLTDAFRPFAREFMSWLINSSQRFEDWANGLAGNAKFEEFLDSIRTVLPLLGDLGKNVGELFVNLTIAVEPFSVAILDAVNNALEFINALDPKVLSGILGAVGGLVAGLMVLSGVMAGVGAAAAVVSAMTGSLFTQIAASLAAFIVVNSTAIGAMAATGETTSILGDAAAHLGSAFEGLADFGRDVWGMFGDLLDALEPLMPVVGDFLADILELTTSLGGGLLAALGVVVDIIGGLATAFGNLDEGTQTLILTVLAAWAAWDKFGGGISTAIDSIKTWSTFGAEFIKGMTGKGGLVGGLEATGLSAEVAAKKVGDFKSTVRTMGGIAIAAASIFAMSEAMGKMNEVTAPATKEAEGFDAALQGMTISSDKAKEGLDALFSAEEGGGLGSISDRQAFRDPIDGMSSAMERMADRTQGAGGRMGEFGAEIKTVFGLFGDTEWDAIRGQIDGLDDSLARLVSTDFEGASSSFREMAGAMEDAGIKQEQIMYHFSDYRKELENTAAQLGINKLTEEEYYAWMMGAVPESVAVAVEAQGLQEEGLAGVEQKTDDAEQATRRLIDAQDELAGRFLTQEEANLRYFEVLDEYEEHMASATKTLDVQTEAGRENRRMMADMAEATRAKADADLAATGDVQAFTDTIWDQRDELYNTAKQFGLTDDEANDYTNTLLGIPPNVDTKAELKDYASEKAKGIAAVIDDIPENVTIDVVMRAIELGIEDISDPNNLPPHLRPRRHGGIDIAEYANGGLRPMEPVAQMVKPNTWRVVGDRMKDDEAYIPLDGSARSKSILFEAMSRMPGLFMEHGGIVGFANGAVAGAASAAPAAAGEEGAELAQVSEAFAALEAALRAGFGALLADLLGMSQEFFAQLMVAHLAYNEQALAASALFRETETARDSEWRALATETLLAHQAATSSAEATHQGTLAQSWSTYRSTQASHWADHRANDLSAASTYFSELQSRTGSAQGTLRSSWATTFDQISSIASTYRSNELSDMQGFHNENARMITQFGTGARSEWSRIWTDLRNSAKSIFGEVPGDVGGILVDVSKKLNEHIVDPFNKIIKDLDLKDIEKLGSFPTQSHATGGHIALRDGGMMSGYTPGRDVHRFVSPTGGILELSGGEPVLRPEVGAVLGEDWVNKVNATARNQGVQGVKNLFGGGAGQAFADGGVWRNLWGIVHEQFPNARLTSAKRNGSGGSYHNTGRAVDVAGPTPMDVPFMKRIYEFIHDNYGNSSELIFTPGGGKNILNGAYHTYNAATRANHRDHVHWANTHRFSDVVGPPTGGSAMGLYDIAGNMEGWIKKASDSMSEGFLPDVAMGSFSNLFTEVAKQKQDAFITDHSHMINDPGGPGGGVGRWRSMVNMALEHMNQPTSEAMINIVLRRMRQESNGNPRAINLWDSNARRGIPSKGLMQVIDPTFAAHRDRSLGNDIWDPMQNIVASMRYALSRYGSLPAAYNRPGGYAEGGMIDLNPEVLFRDGGGSIPTGYSIVHNNLAHEETALPYTTAQVTKEFQRLQEIDHQPVDQSVRFDNVRFEGDPDQMYETAMRHQRVASINRPMKI